MDKILEIHGVKIPTVNHKHIYNRKTGKYFLNPEYRDFKKYLAIQVKPSVLQWPYVVSIQMETALDIDNPIKCILDALQESGIIEDDKYIIKLIVDKKPVARGKANSIIVYVGGVS